jgi:hypothetical protein
MDEIVLYLIGYLQLKLMTQIHQVQPSEKLFSGYIQVIQWDEGDQLRQHSK